MNPYRELEVALDAALAPFGLTRTFIRDGFVETGRLYTDVCTTFTITAQGSPMAPPPAPAPAPPAPPEYHLIGRMPDGRGLYGEVPMGTELRIWARELTPDEEREIASRKRGR